MKRLLLIAAQALAPDRLRRRTLAAATLLGLLVVLAPGTAVATIDANPDPDAIGAPADGGSVRPDARERQLPDEFTPSQSVSPAYYLGWLNHGVAGPCSGTGAGVYQGKYTLPSAISTHYTSALGNIRHYSTAIVSIQQSGTNKYTTFRHRGFNSAFRYMGCNGSAIAYRYYGADKVSRTATLTQTCRQGSCAGGTMTYGAWGYHNWS